MSVNENNIVQHQIKAISQELEEAFRHLNKVESAVSIFGSARTKPDSKYYKLAYEVSRLLAEAGFTIISGGGPGIMEAANKGSAAGNGRSIGLNIKLPHEQAGNPYQTDSLYFEYFVSRKTTFFMNSCAYVVMPGGFGTLDELFETLTLIQTGKAHGCPIVFVGKDFWQGLLSWFQDQLIGQGYISPHDVNLYIVEDDPHRIVEFLKANTQPNEAPVGLI